MNIKSSLKLVIGILSLSFMVSCSADPAADPEVTIQQKLRAALDGRALRQKKRPEP